MLVVEMMLRQDKSSHPRVVRTVYSTSYMILDHAIFGREPEKGPTKFRYTPTTNYRFNRGLRSSK